MKVLVVGSGGREHALIWKIKQSPLVDKVFTAPGNPGIAEEGAECVPIAPDDVNGLLVFAQQEDIGLTVVGPEAPLYLGIVDRFTEAGLKIFGPSQAAVQIERDKGVAMGFMNRHGIPTGWHKVFRGMGEVFDFADERYVSSDRPLVIKNPYPALGKGSFICDSGISIGHALAQIREQQTKRGDPTAFLVMEYLEGEEVSITDITDGERIMYLNTS